MPKLFDRVKVNTSTTGTGDVTFGSVASNAFLTPTEAGCADTDTVRYVIVDGTDYEEGIGTIKSSVAAMARTNVTKSKISGTVGTTKLNLSGTAVIAFIASAADIVNAASVTTVGNALLTAADAAAGQTAIGGTTVGKALFTATDAAAARTALDIQVAPAGHIVGITLANNATDATNDIDFGDGECASDSVSPILMKHSAGTAQLDVAYGTGTGGRFDSSIADGTWHCFVISDGTTVSRGFSQSLDPTGAPNYPSGYAYRRVGSIIRATSILAFVQIGRKFLRKAPFQKFNTTNPGTSAVTGDAGVPSGIAVTAILSFQLTSNTLGTSYAGLATALSQTDSTPSTSLNNFLLRTGVSAGAYQSITTLEVPTDTSSHFRYRLSVSDSSVTISCIAHGWIDDLTPT